MDRNQNYEQERTDAFGRTPQGCVDRNGNLNNGVANGGVTPIEETMMGFLAFFAFTVPQFLVLSTGVMLQEMS